MPRQNPPAMLQICSICCITRQITDVFFFFLFTPASPHLSFLPSCEHIQSSMLTGQDKTSAASHQAQKWPTARSFASSWLALRRGTHLFIPAAIDDTLVTSSPSSSPSSSHPPPLPCRYLLLKCALFVCVFQLMTQLVSVLGRACTKIKWINKSANLEARRQTHTHTHAKDGQLNVCLGI